VLTVPICCKIFSRLFIEGQDFQTILSLLSLTILWTPSPLALLETHGFVFSTVGDAEMIHLERVGDSRKGQLFSEACDFMKLR
jgi:hypothetical protein